MTFLLNSKFTFACIWQKKHHQKYIPSFKRFTLNKNVYSDWRGCRPWLLFDMNYLLGISFWECGYPLWFTLISCVDPNFMAFWMIIFYYYNCCFWRFHNTEVFTPNIKTYKVPMLAHLWRFQQGSILLLLFFLFFVMIILNH